MQYIAVKRSEHLEKLLMLCRCSIVGDERDIVSSIFAKKGYPYVYCGLSVFRCRWIIQDARSKIVDASLTLR